MTPPTLGSHSTNLHQLSTPQDGVTPWFFIMETNATENPAWSAFGFCEADPSHRGGNTFAWAILPLPFIVILPNCAGTRGSLWQEG